MPLQAIQAGLDAARAGDIDSRALAARLREAQLPDTLPPRYGEVLQQLADRLESSALFSGESCSFSESDLFDAVQAWLDRASGI